MTWFYIHKNKPTRVIEKFQILVMIWKLHHYYYYYWKAAGNSDEMNPDSSLFLYLLLKTFEYCNEKLQVIVTNYITNLLVMLLESYR